MATQNPLFSLPAELRLAIYEYAFRQDITQPFEITSTPSWWEYYKRERNVPTTYSLCFIDQATFSEALTVVLATHEVVIRDNGELCQLTQTKKYLTDAIRALTVDLGHAEPGAPQRALNLAALMPRLKKLEIRILRPAYTVSMEIEPSHVRLESRFIRCFFPQLENVELALCPKTLPEQLAEIPQAEQKAMINQDMIISKINETLADDLASWQQQRDAPGGAPCLCPVDPRNIFKHPTSQQKPKSARTPTQSLFPMLRGHGR